MTYVVNRDGIFRDKTEMRAYMRGRPSEVPKALELQIAQEWIRECCAPAPRENRSKTSYGLKHAAERWDRARGVRLSNHSYVSNGALIAAMIEAGYDPVIGVAETPNCYFRVRRVRAGDWS